MTTTAEHYFNKIAPQGSSLYYSLRSTPSEKRSAILAVNALFHEIDNTLTSSQERSIVETKLEWWRQEVGRLFANEARHPITQALSSAVHDYRLPQTLFNEYIDGIKLKLDLNHLCSEKDLNLYCYRNTGIKTLLTCFILGQTQQETLAFAHDMAIAFEVTAMIRNYREAALAKRILFPLDDLKKHKIELDTMHKLNKTKCLQALLKFEAHRARKYYLTALNMLPKVDRKAQRHLLILGRLEMTVLDEIEQDEFNVIDYRTELTPLRKLWISWRTM